jgi:hypothetical protein
MQINENKTAGAKASNIFVARTARLKACPDTSCNPYGILLEAEKQGRPKISRWIIGSVFTATDVHTIYAKSPCWQS